MDYQSRMCIEKAVLLITKAYDIKTPITNIDDVVAKMNGKIIEVPSYSMANVIQKCNEEGIDFTISILKGQRNDRRNMSIAQNLGTLFLHMGYMTDNKRWNNINGNTLKCSSFEMDFEKDEFACNFLMPRAEFLKFISQNAQDKKIDTYKIAQFFGVPNGIAVKRGKWMGALRW